MTEQTVTRIKQPKRRILAWVPEELAERLDVARDGRPMGVYVARLLEFALAQIEPEPRGAALMDLHEQERLRVQAEAPERPADFLNVYGAYLAGEAAARARVLALIDRELEHVRLADGQLGDVLRALRKDVEEGIKALVDRIDQHGHEDRAAAASGA